MSGAIKINGTSSGSTTITAPASGGDETIELSTALADKAALAGATFTGTVAVDRANFVARRAVADSSVSFGNVQFDIDGTTQVTVHQPTAGDLSVRRVNGVEHPIPYAVAAGTWSTYSGVPVTVTLPANRFVQAPIVVAAIGDQIGLIRVYDVTTTNFKVGAYGSDGANLGAEGQWTATQMTTAASAG